MATTPYRILIVDDEEDIRSIVRSILETKYEVLEAYDGLDALQKLRYCQPDMAVLDVMMPMMDGFQACESIRKDPVYNGLPVLFLTALNTKPDIMQGYKAGANLFLTKPFDPDRLLKNIEVFFETNNIQPRPKKFSKDQLGKLFDRVEGMKQAFDGKESDDSSDSMEVAYGRGFADDPSGEHKAAPAPASQPAPAVAPPKAEGALPRVLAVEDEEDILDVLQTGLAGQYELVKATDGIEAIERIVKYEPDIVILDAMMPRMSGYQLCKSLRRNRRFASTPIVFISGKATDKDIAYAKRLGADDFIPKPFEIGQILDVLEKMQQKPGFNLYEKRHTIDELQSEEQKMAQERREREKNRQDENARTKSDGPNELEKFIKDHRDG